MQTPAIIPMLPVKSMPASVAFYEKLGFAVENRNNDWRWAMLRWENSDCRIMLDESINARPDATRQHVLYLYPDDVGAFHQQLRNRGVEIPDLTTTFYGITEFRLEDPDGNPLWIGQAQTSS